MAKKDPLLMVLATRSIMVRKRIDKGCTVEIFKFEIRIQDR